MQDLPPSLARCYAATHAAGLLRRLVLRGRAVPHRVSLLRSARGDRDLQRTLGSVDSTLRTGALAGTPRGVALSTLVDPIVLGGDTVGGEGGEEDSMRAGGEIQTICSPGKLTVLRPPLSTSAMRAMLHNPGLAQGLGEAATRSLRVSALLLNGSSDRGGSIAGVASGPVSMGSMQGLGAVEMAAEMARCEAGLEVVNALLCA